MATSRVVADCDAHGALTQHYSVAQLQSALANIPADVEEYTNCYNVIQNQLYAQLGGKHGSGSKSSSGGGGAFLPTPVIVVIAVLIVGGGALVGVAIQRRGSATGES
jgi:hypothetical protein